MNGIDTTPDLTATLGRATRAQYLDGAGEALIETWTLSGMGHGTPIDPALGCGTAGPYILDVSLCSSRWAAEFFGLVPADGGKHRGRGRRP